MLISWSNSQLIYAAYNNVLYKSTDQAKTFAAVKTGLSFDSNGGGMRTNGRHGEIDPQNSDHVLFGDGQSMYRTINGGADWSPAASVPAAGAINDSNKGFSGVAFNRYSALAGGRTSEAIVSTAGTFWRTTDGGDHWADISSGGPGAEPNEAEFDSQSRYTVAVNTGGLFQWHAGSWTTLHNNNDSDTTFFIDPANADHIYLNRGVNIAWEQSTDNGMTWGDAVWDAPTQTSVDNIPWHSTNPHYYPANALVDTANDIFWLLGGNQGVASASVASLAGAGPYTIDMHGIGIEQMCINIMVTPPGSKKVHAAVWDEDYAEMDRDNVNYPSVVNNLPTGNFGASWGLAGSKEDPAYLARWVSNDNGGGTLDQSGYTTDSGATWHPFTAFPNGTTSTASWGHGAHVAYSGKDNIIVVSSDTNNTSGDMRMPYYTIDRGQSWHPVTLPTAAWTYDNLAGIHAAYYLAREILVADATQLQRFYFMVYANDDTFAGIYSTDDGGATWTRKSGLPTNEFVGNWNWNVHTVSPVTNHLWMTTGPQGGHDPGTPGTSYLYRSVVGGASFVTLPNVQEPAKFGFGAPATDGGYPVLFMEGFYNGAAGMWMTANADADSPTWINIGDAPNTQYSSPAFIIGDPDVAGRVYVATGCAGVQFGEFGSLLH